MKLKHRLIAVFLLAAVVPLAATLWITTSLLEHSLSLAPVRELDETSRLLETTGRALYQNAREVLKSDAASGKAVPSRYPAMSKATWPSAVLDFFNSADAEAFRVSGRDGQTLEYLVRRGGDVFVYARPIGGPGMAHITRQLTGIRSVVERDAPRNLRKGFVFTLVLLAAFVWLIAMIVLVFWANRISKPVQQLTAGLAQLAAGDFSFRIDPVTDGEIGDAMKAFNRTASELEQSRERLIHLTRVASWQTLARKMAHEVKNSLTPIRLTMEEVSARRADHDDQFLEQAAQIVVEEVISLERRVRAFSEFAAEPPVRIGTIDVNALLEDRIAFLKTAHPEVKYSMSLSETGAEACADEDLVKGVLTNLLENAAEAAGGGGAVLGKTFAVDGKVGIEIHDSGPGLSALARGSLFEPTISFKKTGMGLGLSIAKRSALLSGGDIVPVEGELGGAAFRLLLPAS